MEASTLQMCGELPMYHTLATKQERCLRCHRPLTRTQGPYGPKCQRRIQRAAEILSGSKHPVAARAAAILLGGQIRRTTHKTGVYRRQAEHGTVAYIVTQHSCGCLAGQHDKLCCHRAAFLVLIGAKDI